jgi:hypothetical protein
MAREKAVKAWERPSGPRRWLANGRRQERHGRRRQRRKNGRRGGRAKRRVRRCMNFTFSLPFLYQISWCCGRGRPHSGETLHFLYHIRELRFQPSLRDLEVVHASPPNTQVLGYSRMSLRDKRMARFQICKSYWHWMRTSALRENFTFSFHFLYRNRV